MNYGSAGDRLKERVFVEVVPLLARGFLLDRCRRLGLRAPPSEQDLKDVFEGTLTLLYRLLFLLYAEARDLLPVRNPAYGPAGLQRIKEEIADKAGAVASESPERLKVYREDQANLYDRLLAFFVAIDHGNPGLNVPCCKVGLSLPERAADRSDRDQRISCFLGSHKVPDRFLAPAIDRLARDADEKTSGLAFIDYKSMATRHLGSIYEGLLEYKLKIAEKDLAARREKKITVYVPLVQAAKGRGKKSAAPAVRKGEAYLFNTRAERKATGSYYTPDHIVGYIVEHTVGPVLDEKFAVLEPEFRKAGKTYQRLMEGAALHPPTRDADFASTALAQTYAEHKDLVNRIFDIKVLDPAMGSGHFLVKAVGFIADRLLDFLNHFPHNPVEFLLDQMRGNILKSLGAQGTAVDPGKLTHRHLVKRQVLTRCIYGMDLDPMAVELAKVSLWLDAFALGAPIDFLDHHLRCGNSLVGGISVAELLPADARQEAAGAGFDAIIGNPPYAGHKGDFDPKPLKRFFHVCRRYANPATAFCEQALRLLAHSGRYGLILPKSIQYVEAWSDARTLLAVDHGLDRLIDVSQAFEDVLLEQTICIGRKERSANSYHAAAADRHTVGEHREIPLSVLEDFGCLPAILDKNSLQLLNHIVATGPKMGSVSYTCQALGYQSKINRSGDGIQMPIYRGRHVRPMQIESTSDWIDRHFLINPSTHKHTNKVSAMLSPKVVSQNIVAHVSRPKPRIWIISAPDTQGILCLNTISATTIKDARFTPSYIATILNSSLASWFLYEFVFCRAIRTMHLDNYYLGKLPLAVPTDGILERCERLRSDCQRQMPRGTRQLAIDSIVFEAFGLTEEMRTFIHRYCYGTTNLVKALDGSPPAG